MLLKCDHIYWMDLRREHCLLPALESSRRDVRCLPILKSSDSWENGFGLSSVVSSKRIGNLILR